MVRPLPAEYLQPDEDALHLSDREMRSVLDEYLAILVGWLILGGTVLAVFLLFLPTLFRSVALPVLILITTLAVLGIVLRYRHVATTRYVITPERVYKAYGRLVFVLQQTTYDKVTDLHIHQSFFGRIWGFGTVTLQTAGTGIALHGVHDPVAVKRRIESARRRFIETLIGEHLEGRPVPGVAAATPDVAGGETSKTAGAESPDEATPIWKGGPSLPSLVANLLSTASIMALAVVAGFGALASDALSIMLIAGVFLLIALATLLATWVEYRHTRYEVHQEGVVVTKGWLSRRRMETTYDKVTDVSTQQGILGRLLGFGTITVNTAGSNQAPVVFRGLHRPDDVKQAIDQARRAHREARRR